MIDEARLETVQTIPVSLTVNGQPWQGGVPAEEVLLDLLRNRIGLTGTKRGCESEVCGACEVLVDGGPVSSCNFLAFETNGRSITTIEGIADGDRLHPVQEAFIRNVAAQCGYCTPGQIMSAVALLREDPSPTYERIAHWMVGNICRCGCYPAIARSIMEAGAELREQSTGGHSGPARPLGELRRNDSDGGAARIHPELARSDGPRVDLRAKVTGKAQYLEDLPEPPNIAYAATIRSPYSHARIVSIDPTPALALPGVLGVLTRDQLDEYELNLSPEPWDRHFVCTDRARFAGDLIGMIVAEDLRTARRAAQLVDVDYEILPPIFSASEALASSAPLIYEDKGDNQAAVSTLSWGDVENSFTQADLILEGTYSCPPIFHHPIEPVMSIIVDWTTDVMELWTPSNNAFDVVDVNAELFGVQPEQVRVHVPYVGGNFGAKHWTRELSVAAALSSRIGRPVKYVATEEESFLITSRHAMTYKGKVGVKSDGRVVALDVDLEIDTGSRANTSKLVNGQATRAARGAYSVPNLRVRSRSAFTNKVSSAHFRNTGKSQPQFAVEMLMDQAARQLGIDPIDFKSKNLQKRGQGLAAGRAPRESTGSTSPAAPHIDFPPLMKMTAEAIGWDGRATRHTPEEQQARFVRGRGLAVSLRRGSANGVASALAVLERDGRVSISHNAPDVGGGEYTMIAVVASRTLGVPQSLVRVDETDTSNNLRYGGTSSQRTTVHMGNAVHDACAHLKDEMVKAAARGHEGDPGEWQIQDGVLTRDGVRITTAELAAALSAGETLRGSGFYEQTGAAEGGGDSNNNYWSPGVSAVEVEVDRETGVVRIAKYAALADAGTIIHYHSARGQIEGGVILGLGATLFEEVCYDEGQLLNADAFQYRLPQLGDIPEDFQTILLEAEKGPGPFGAKGIANTSIGCVAPAVGNAIYDAVGVRLTSLPLSPEKVLRALGTLPPAGS